MALSFTSCMNLSKSLCKMGIMLSPFIGMFRDLIKQFEVLLECKILLLLRDWVAIETRDRQRELSYDWKTSAKVCFLKHYCDTNNYTNASHWSSKADGQGQDWIKCFHFDPSNIRLPERCLPTLKKNKLSLAGLILMTYSWPRPETTFLNASFLIYLLS